MLLSPRNFKYRKQQKGKSINRIVVKSKDTKNLIFGEIGLKSIESGRLTAKQMQSVRQVINKKIKKNRKVKNKRFSTYTCLKKTCRSKNGER
jgi:large subunit ribosomal protein L16